MAGIDDDYDGFLDTRPRGGYRFPSATQGLSSFGARELDRYNKLVQQESGLSSAMMELQLEKDRFDFQSKQREMQIALREQRDKNRIAEDGIKALKSLDLLVPEDPDYFTMRSELIKTMPYAMYDRAFTNALGTYDDRNRRHNELTEMQDRAEKKQRHRETYTAYKGLLDSMSGTELYEFSPDVLNLNPDSDIQDLTSAVSKIRMSRATKELDNDLEVFGYTPSDFGDDLAAKARAVSGKKRTYEDLSKQLTQTQTIFRSYEQAYKESFDPDDKARRDAALKQLDLINQRMDALRAKKDKDGNLVSATNSAGEPSGNYAQRAMELTRQVANAKAGDTVAGQKVTPAAILAAQNRLKLMEQASKNPTTSAEPRSKSTPVALGLKIAEDAAATQLLPPGAAAVINTSKTITRLNSD